MMPLDEKDLQLLAEVLPSVSAQLRSSMANVFAAANRHAPAEAREADPTRSASVPSRFSRGAAARCAFPPATRATSSHSTPPCSSARF